MGSLTIQSDGKGNGLVQLTVTQPPPIFYAPSTWKLFVKKEGRPIFSMVATSSTWNGRDQLATATFSATKKLGFLRNCGACEFAAGNYQVIGTNDLFEPPFLVIDTGSVTVVGEVGCCPDDEDDDGGDTGGGDTGGGESDPLPPNPPVPPAPCLPSSYIAGAPPVSTPCSTGSGGSGPSLFGTP
jgi:hypothetical protein